MPKLFEALTHGIPGLAQGILTGKEILGKDEDRKLKQQTLAIKERELAMQERLYEAKLAEQAAQVQAQQQVMGLLGGMQPKAITPQQPGQPGYGVGEEAMGGMGAVIPGQAPDRGKLMGALLQSGYVGKEQVGHFLGLEKPQGFISTPLGVFDTGSQQYVPSPHAQTGPPAPSPGTRIMRRVGPQGQITYQEVPEQKPEGVSAEGLTNPVIQAGLSIADLPRNPREWTADHWERANKRMASLYQQRAISINPRLLNQAKETFPDDPDAAWNEYLRLVGQQAGTQGYYGAFGHGAADIAPAPAPGQVFPRLPGQAQPSPRALPVAPGKTTVPGSATTQPPDVPAKDWAEQNAEDAASERETTQGMETLIEKRTRLREGAQPLPPASARELAILKVALENAKEAYRMAKADKFTYFGPMRGRYGGVMESFPGIAGTPSKNEINVRRRLASVTDAILRFKSGAQIGQYEYPRLEATMVTINQPFPSAEERFKGFIEEAEAILREYTEGVRRPRSQAGQGVGRSPSTPGGPESPKIKNLRDRYGY